jgi:hypothetical protein
VRTIDPSKSCGLGSCERAASLRRCRALAAAALVAFAPAVVAYPPKRFFHGAAWTMPRSATINTTTNHLSVAIGLMFLGEQS